MAKQLVFYKGRYNTVQVNLGINITGQTIASQIRERPDETSDVILTWIITVTNAATGEFTLSFNDSTPAIDASNGWMDIKRVTGSGDIPCFDEPLAVEFRGAITA